MNKLTRLFLTGVGLAAFSKPASAQFNKVYTYYWSGTPARSVVLDLLPGNPNATTALIAVDSLTPGINPANLLALKGTDYLGTPLFNRIFFLPDSSLRLEPWRMVRTQDSGYLVVGRALRLSTPAPPGTVWSDPFAAKFSPAGAFMWARRYPTNPAPYRDEAPTVVARVEDDSSESYMIVRAGAPYHPAYGADATINALRIDGAGNLLWNKRYASSNRLTSGDSAVRDYPTALAFVRNGGYYAIAGTRATVRPFPSASDTTLMIFTLDRNGGIALPYRTMRVPAYPSGVDLIYDQGIVIPPAPPAVVLSFIQNRNKLVDSSGTIHQSQVSILRLRTNLTTIDWWRHYWQNDSVINYRGTRLKTTLSRAHYLVTSDLSTKSIAQAPWQASMLKVSTSTGSPAFWNRYNVARTGLNRALLTYSAASTERHIFGGATNSVLSPLTDSRLIQTNTGGLACGARSYGVFTAARADTFTVHSYTRRDTASLIPFALVEPAPSIVETPCDTLNPDYGRQLGGGNEQGGALAREEDFRVYPTLLEGGDARITVEATLQQDDWMDVAVYSLAGTKLTTGRYPALKGHNVFDLPLPQMPAGVYVVVAGTEKGSMHRVVRIVRR